MNASRLNLSTKLIVGLSPMDGVTDLAFRQITKKYGHPDLMYTEFVSVEGLCHNASKLIRELRFKPDQRPIIAQVFGTTPKYFRQVAVLLCQLGFDGIDINMGCPAKTVAQSGAGAALIQTPKLAKKIIRAVKQGVRDWQEGMQIQNCPDIDPQLWQVAQQYQSLDQNHRASNISKKTSQNEPRNPVPISVKTRIGFSQPVLRDWVENLLEEGLDMLAIHGRTLKQGYAGQADWQQIGLAAQLAKQYPTLLLGNGDIESRSQAVKLCKQYNLDGALIGRASFGNPFVFTNQPMQSRQIMAKIALEHSRLYEEYYQSDTQYSFLPMRKHLGWYMSGFSHAKNLRIKLFTARSSQEVAQILFQTGLIE